MKVSCAQSVESSSLQLFNMSNKSMREYSSLQRCIQQAGGRAMRAQMKQLPQARKVP